MISVIGLFNEEGDAARSIQKLKDAGFSEDRISLITRENAIHKLLGCEPACVMRRYAAWGASIGIAIYATLGIFAGICQCNLLHLDPAYGIGTFLGGTLAGAFVGGALGCLVGAAEYEKDSHLYIQGARMGGRVIAIQADEEDAENVKLILEREKALGVKAL
jgi:hypothetical protein